MAYYFPACCNLESSSCAKFVELLPPPSDLSALYHIFFPIPGFFYFSCSCSRVSEGDGDE